jgi:hypothetical protein
VKCVIANERALDRDVRYIDVYSRRLWKPERAVTRRSGRMSRRSRSNVADKAPHRLVRPLSDSSVSFSKRRAREQNKVLQFVYTQLKAAYEYEYDESFELNRHFYPLILAHALPELRDLDAGEVRTELKEMNTPTKTE